MLASQTSTLFNEIMDTNSPLNARIRNHGLVNGRKIGHKPAKAGLADPTLPASGQAHADGDWQAAGIMDQMVAYRDWWNLPARRPHGAAKLR